jgi:hypothetical protein
VWPCSETGIPASRDHDAPSSRSGVASGYQRQRASRRYQHSHSKLTRGLCKTCPCGCLHAVLAPLDTTSLEMSSSLEALPNELLLQIFKNLPNVWDVALTNKVFLPISADVLRQRVVQAINNSNFAIAKSTLEVVKRLLSNTRVPDDYFSGVVAAGRDVIIQAINNSRPTIAESTLEVIKQLPSNTRIPDGFLPPMQVN